MPRLRSGQRHARGNRLLTSGDDYDRAYVATPELFGAEPEPVLVRFADHIQGPRPVIDVGCGQGRHSRWLAGRGHPVIALDPSREALAQLPADPLITPVLGGFGDVSEDLAPFAATCVFGLLQILDLDQRAELLAAVDGWSVAGSLLFLTAWTTADPGRAAVAAEWSAVAENVHRAPDGRVRSYLPPGEAPQLVPGWEILHHWEGPGPWHRHGHGDPERHGLVELVARR